MTRRAVAVLAAATLAGALTACAAAPTAADAGTGAPAACLEALDHTDTLRLITADVLDVAAVYPGLIPRAAQAGLERDVPAVEQLTVEMGELNTRVQTLQTRVEPVLAKLEQAQAGCRAAG